MNNFIKQQQELAKESIIETFEDGTIRYCPRDLETQIEKIITNTGDELMKRVEEERGEVGERLNTFLSGYQWGSYRTINAIESEIKTVTGLRKYYDNKSRSNRPK